MKYKLTTVNAVCPVCCHTEAELLYEITSEQAAQWFFLEELEADRHIRIQKAIETVWQGKEARFLRCQRCKFGFADPYAAGDSNFYETLYEAPNYPAWKWEFEQTLRSLQQKLRSGEVHKPYLLEIGAGDGAFLGKLIQEKVVPPADMLALEYSVYGKRKIEEMGVSCLATDVRLLTEDMYERPFNVVCMFQVLEHLDDLEGLFQCINKITVKNASMFIAVPNDRRVAFNEEHEALGDMAPCHVGRWNKDSFTSIADRFGWQVVQHGYEPESKIWRFLEFSLYRYVQQTKVSGSIFNWAETISNRLLRYVFQIPLISLMAIRSLHLLPQLSGNDMGKGQWVEMRKREKKL